MHHYISLSSDQERNEWFDSLQAVLKKIKETRSTCTCLEHFIDLILCAIQHMVRRWPTRRPWREKEVAITFLG